MSSWLKGGRLAILEAVAAACDEVDERARAETETRDRKNKQLLEELEALKTRVAQVDRLQQENESLQAEIGRLRNIQDGRPVPRNERKALSELSPNKTVPQPHASTNKVLSGTPSGPDPATFKAVVAKCKDLDIKYKEACKLVEDHRLVLRKRNNTIDEWARYSDGLQSTIEELRSRLRSRPCSIDGAATARADGASGPTTGHDETDGIAFLKRPNPYSTSDDNSSSPLLVATSRGNPTLLPPRRILSEPPPLLPLNNTFRRTGSGTTDESGRPATALPTTSDVDLPPYQDLSIEACLPTIKVEPSSDTPVIVSTRSVRKRKRGNGESDGRKRQTVKSEHSSSSGPEITRESHHYSPAESIDFDEEIHVPTPRKRRAILQDQRKYGDKTSEDIPSPKLLFSGHVAMEVSNASNKSHAPSHDVVDPKTHMSSALHDSLPQLQRTGRADIMDNSASPNIYTSHLALGVKDLAEDGDAEGEDPGLIPVPHPSFKGRLDALLNSPSVQARPPIQRDGRPRAQTPRPVPVRDSDAGAGSSMTPQQVSGRNVIPRGTLASAVPKQSTRASLSPKPSASRDRALKKPSILRDDMPRGRSITREKPPLRERPVESLRPEDFKPNPLYNDGLTFVYDEVVRGKDARAALSGCIDPNCCGKTFRHFAEVELKSSGSSVTLRADDVGLMERYLGDEAFKLGTMTREEREEVWLTAKTRELANKFGKHRHRYSRMPTPPGFWSMDFPSTQERAEELRQAEAVRRALVNERHREAMRCKGSWLFRDEDPR